MSVYPLFSFQVRTSSLLDDAQFIIAALFLGRPLLCPLSIHNALLRKVQGLIGFGEHFLCTRNSPGGRNYALLFGLHTIVFHYIY